MMHPDPEPREGRQCDHKPTTQAWYSNDIKVEVRGNNEIHLIARYGEDRYLNVPNVEDLIQRLQEALVKCRA